MLHIQTELIINKKTPEEIAEPLGIKIRKKEGKVLFSYDQIDSSKFKDHPIVKESRGLILYEKDWSICSYGFNRFFNVGESCADKLPEDLNDCYVLEKLDGSYTALYFDEVENHWAVNTRSIIDASGPVNNVSNITFGQLFWSACENNTHLPYLIGSRMLNTRYTYIFELCSPFNRIVTKYTDTSISLLTVRDNVTLNELPSKEVDKFAESLKVKRPKRYSFNNISELLKMEKEDGSSLDPDFEGYVAVKEQKEGSHLRVKIKQPSYLSLHRFATSVSERNLLEVIINNAQDDILSNFPEYKEQITSMIDGLKKIELTIREDWSRLSSIENRKEFALQATKTLFPSYLFALKDNKVCLYGLREYMMGQRIDSLLDALGKVR